MPGLNAYVSALQVMEDYRMWESDLESSIVVLYIYLYILGCTRVF